MTLQTTIAHAEDLAAIAEAIDSASMYLSASMFALLLALLGVMLAISSKR